MVKTGGQMVCTIKDNCHRRVCRPHPSGRLRHTSIAVLPFIQTAADSMHGPKHALKATDKTGNTRLFRVIVPILLPTKAPKAVESMPGVV